ncbi:hypothetical protein RRG08_065350 [Elysia crispata]|uniref:Uncharacterized protein n=1 Tax=Elysia crispata TaxID=231223 RepID=A0AAE1DY64_9GAST|nr:hypothetical protein RRG08_065350 [Elysia crispata]
MASNLAARRSSAAALKDKQNWIPPDLKLHHQENLLATWNNQMLHGNGRGMKHGGKERLDPVDKALSNKNESGISTGNDGRGFRSPYNRTHEDQRNGIRLHLNLFPCVESLYIRKSITRRFLDSNLTMSKVFHLFKAKYNKEGIEPCSEHLYRQVFSNEFNFAFFKPKKGICVICHRYKQFSPQEKVEKMDEHAAHHKSREDAMKAKARTQGSGRRGRQVYNSIVRLAKCFTIVIKQTSLSNALRDSAPEPAVDDTDEEQIKVQNNFKKMFDISLIPQFTPPAVMYN